MKRLAVLIMAAIIALGVAMPSCGTYICDTPSNQPCHPSDLW